MKKLLFTFFILLAPTLASAATIGKVNSNNIGLVGWWTFDGADQATSVRDKSGNGFTMNPSGFVVGSSTKLGKIGQALNFDGINDDVSTSGSSPASTGLITTEVTVSAWIKPSNLSNEHAIYTAGGEWIVETSATNLQWLDSGGPGGLSNGGSQGTAAILTKDEWQHVVFVGSSAGIKIYRNGVLGLNSGITLLGSGSSATHLIGSSGSRYFAGGIDDVRVYNRVLSQTEIVALYNSGSAGVARSSVGSTTAPLASGLVGYWTLDGSKTNWATGKTLDSSGAGLTGTLISLSTTTSTAIGKVGQGLQFDGANSEISISGSDIAAPCTMAGWVKLDSQKSNGSASPILSASSNVNTSFRAEQVGSDSVGLTTGGVFDYIFASPGFTVPLNTWTHLVTILNSSTQADLYANGVYSGTITSASGLVCSRNRISRSGTGFLPGTLDDVRVYNRVLTDVEVTELYNASLNKIAQSPISSAANGLIGYWTLDGSKTNWATGKTLDSSGSGNTGTLVNMSTTTSPTLGRVGQAFKFDGLSTYISLSTSAYRFSNTTFTVSAWIKTSSTAQNFIVDQGDGVDTGWVIGTSINCTAGQLTAFVKDVTNSQIQRCSSSLVSDGQWHHVLAVIKTDTSVSSNQNIDLYIDGVLNQGNLLPSAAGYRANTGVLNIGRRLSTGVYFNGNIDDVRIYNRALSAQEVQQLYNMSK